MLSTKSGDNYRPAQSVGIVTEVLQCKVTVVFRFLAPYLFPVMSLVNEVNFLLRENDIANI